MADRKYLNEVGLAEVADHVNKRLKVVSVMPISADDKAVRLYIGETTASYIKGGIYQYDATNLTWNLISAENGDSIEYVNSLPSSGIKNILYGLVSSVNHTATVDDGFLDDDTNFEKIDSGVNYSYVAADGKELEVGTDGVTYKQFVSIDYDGTDFIISYTDETTATLAVSDTFYYRNIIRTYYAGNEDEQTLTVLGSGGSGGGNYSAGDGIDITNDVISVIPATTSIIGGVVPDDLTIGIDASGVISGKYEGGYGINVKNNVIKTKTFVGTQAEWDSLTSAVKGEFDSVNIVDDYESTLDIPGHAVLDEDETLMPQRTNAKFVGFDVQDDSINDQTVISSIPYTEGRGIDIDDHEIGCSDEIVGTFVGTSAEWEALTDAEKELYTIVNLTDDVVGGNSLGVDEVVVGEMNAVTSNAVALAIERKVVQLDTPTTTGVAEVLSTYPTGYTYSNCYIEGGYIVDSNYKYPLSATSATVFLGSDGIYGSVTSPAFLSATIYVILRKNP